MGFSFYAHITCPIMKGYVIMKKLNEIKKENKEKIDKATKIAVAFGVGIFVGYTAGVKDTLNKVLQNK